jgi:AcrR family transcriptional regulator
MPSLAVSEVDRSSRVRVLKAPAVRRAEFVDCAFRLFLEKGYEKTTINDVIAAAGLSKGAFYHHFRAKEDLLEAIAARFAEQSLARAAEVDGDPSLDALGRLNLFFAATRGWKAEHLPELKVFALLLKPENAILYHRVVNRVFAAMTPKLVGIIEAGIAGGIFDVPDAEAAADAFLWLSNGRLTLVIDAMESAKAGDIDGATTLLARRLQAEELMIDRILGVPPGSVQILGSVAYVRTMLTSWNEGPPSP